MGQYLWDHLIEKMSITDDMIASCHYLFFDPYPCNLYIPQR